MNGYLILSVHLVKLIDTADTMVGEHECTCFYAEVSGFRVFNNTSRKTCSTRCLSTGVNGARKELTNVLQKLRLSRRRVTDNANVYIATKFYALLGLLLDSTKELQKNSLFDI